MTEKDCSSASVRFRSMQPSTKRAHWFTNSTGRGADMKNQPGPSGPLILFVILLILYVLGAVVEPCDGHSCKDQKTEVQHGPHSLE